MVSDQEFLERKHVPPRAQAIILDVVARHGVSAAELFSSTRTKKLSRARWECWVRMRALRSPWNGKAVWSMERLARLFGKHLRAIQYGLERYEDQHNAAHN